MVGKSLKKGTPSYKITVGCIYLVVGGGANKYPALSHRRSSHSPMDLFLEVESWRTLDYFNKHLPNLDEKCYLI